MRNLAIIAAALIGIAVCWSASAFYSEGQAEKTAQAYAIEADKF